MVTVSTFTFFIGFLVVFFFDLFMKKINFEHKFALIFIINYFLKK